MAVMSTLAAIGVAAAGAVGVSTTAMATGTAALIGAGTVGAGMVATGAAVSMAQGKSALRGMTFGLAKTARDRRLKAEAKNMNLRQQNALYSRAATSTASKIRQQEMNMTEGGISGDTLQEGSFRTPKGRRIFGD